MGVYGTPPKSDGFRFGSVNRPSPPRAIYNKVKQYDENSKRYKRDFKDQKL